MVVAHHFVVLGFGVPNAVLIFYRVPFVPTFSFDHFVAQMPLAVVGGVIVIWEELCEGLYVFGKWDVVLYAAIRVWPETCHLSGTRGRADWGADVCVFEDKAGVSESVQVGCVDPVVSVGRHSVGALLIGKNVYEVGLVVFGHFLLALAFLILK